MKEILNRIKADTPIFFKRIIALGITLAAVGTALIAAESTVQGFKMPPHVESMAQYFIVAGLIASAVAKTAKIDTPNA